MVLVLQDLDELLLLIETSILPSSRKSSMRLSDHLKYILLMQINLQVLLRIGMT